VGHQKKLLQQTSLISLDLAIPLKSPSGESSKLIGGTWQQCLLSSPTGSAHPAWPHRIEITNQLWNSARASPPASRFIPPVQLDLVVQRPKHRRDGLLLGEGGSADFKLREMFLYSEFGCAERLLLGVESHLRVLRL